MKYLLILLLAVAFSSCSENYSNGERIGFVTQFSNTGIIWKSWEGHLNVTQTGMNSSVPFDFSIDNDTPDTAVIKKIDSAANLGWKIKLVYCVFTECYPFFFARYAVFTEFLMNFIFFPKHKVAIICAYRIPSKPDDRSSVT